MKAPKPIQSLAGQTCPACRSGKFALVQIDHVETLGDENEINFRGLWVDKCEHCGQIVFPGDTTHFIETEVAEQTEQLAPDELEHIRETLGVSTQDEMSEILGLGTKTYHKWESGKQLPNRSMCYYIRLLSEFPQAFDWLKGRDWRQPHRGRQTFGPFNFERAFPDLALRCQASSVRHEGECIVIHIESISEDRNPALAFHRTAFSLK